MDGLQEGRIVNYVMKNGEIRPLLVVRLWDGNGYLNGILFVDGSNDDGKLPWSAGDVPRHLSQVKGVADAPVAECVLWVTSVHFDPTKKPGTWHWPERKEQKAKAKAKAKGKAA